MVLHYFFILIIITMIKIVIITIININDEINLVNLFYDDKNIIIHLINSLMFIMFTSFNGVIIQLIKVINCFIIFTITIIIINPMMMINKDDYIYSY